MKLLYKAMDEIFIQGEPLAWEMISSYDNVKSKEGRREYKKSLWSLPTVDHYGDELVSKFFQDLRLANE